MCEYLKGVEKNRKMIHPVEGKLNPELFYVSHNQMDSEEMRDIIADCNGKKMVTVKVYDPDKGSVEKRGVMLGENTFISLKRE